MSETNETIGALLDDATHTETNEAIATVCELLAGFDVETLD